MAQKIPYRNFSIDIVGSCNLRCPTCPVGNTRTKGEGRFTKFMDFDLFKKVIKKIHDNYVVGPLYDGRTPQISLHDWGEPTLHPLLPEFILETKRQGCFVGFSSNFNTSPDWERIILAEPDEIKISLSSLDEENYSLTHRRGKLSKVLSNIKKVVELKKRLNSKTQIRMNYHVYAHNLRDDFDKVVAFCTEENILFSPELAIYMPIEKIIKFREDSDNANLQLNDEESKIISTLLVNPLTQYDKWKTDRKLRENNRECRRQIHKMPIRADGSVPICCGVYGLEHTISDDFINDNIDDIQQKREQYDYCSKCINFGAHASYAVGRRNSLANRLLLRRDIIGTIARRLKYRPLKFTNI